MTETLTDAPSGLPDGAHTLPSGNWVVLKDPRQLTRGDKRKIVMACKGLEAIDAGYVMFDWLAAQLVTAWSYPLPLPADDSNALDGLPIEDDGPFGELIQPARELLFPNRPDPSDHKDEQSPTGASGE